MIAGHLVRRREPHRRERTREVRCDRVEGLGRRALALQHAAQRGGLVRPVDDADLPGLGEHPRQLLPGRRRVRFVDQPEVRLEPVEHAGVGVEQCAVAREQRLEHRLPPGELEFGAHLALRHVPLRQVGEQRVEVAVAQRGEQRGALLQVGEHFGVGREPRHLRGQLGDREHRQRVRRADAAQRDVEPGEVFGDALVGDHDIRDPHRDLGNHAGRSETLPQDALLLDAAQALVEVGDVNAGAHVFEGQLAQATPVRAGHVGRIAPVRRGGDQFGERAVVDGRLELVERLAHVEEQSQVDAEFGDRLEGAHPRLPDQRVRAVEQARKLRAVQLLGELVRSVAFGCGHERGAVPGRIVGSVAELAEPRRLDERIRRIRPVGREQLDREPVEASRRRRRRGQERETGEFVDGVEHRDAEHRVAAHERVAVVEQHLAQAHERVVDFGDPRLRRLLVAPDRLDDVTAQRARGDGQAGEPHLRQPVRDVVEAGTPRADHEHALVLGDEHSDRVDDRLGSARARQRLHDERVACADLGDDVLLLFVGVEQQRVGRGRALVLPDRLDGPVRLLDRAAGGWVACERVEHRVVEVVGVRAHPAGHIREGRHHEPRQHVEPGEVGGEPAQPVDDGLRLEDAVGERERDERLGVERDLELLGQRAGELRVEERLPFELQLEVASVAADRERAAAGSAP